VFLLYLKRLEIKGFKSFADKIDLEFNKGITAVVGPNGSGKSNIADAIRWVLGEQSAKTLRGGRMEDVIFSGTENRKSLGCAEVSLTIDNSTGELPVEFTEVTVTRRLYRSGDSDYLVNNTSCRLKDVLELFMDTGIGKDGYSLIGQGKIEEIISTRSEDRRELFEEAAGIVKYKTRKLEAERKLENTRQNLLRVTDIIQELEEQIEPLKMQSQTARKYLELKEELKCIEISSLLNNYDSSKKKLDKLISELEEINASQMEHESRKSSITVAIGELKKASEDLQDRQEEASSSRLQLEKSMENKQGQMELIKERRENFSKEISRHENEIKSETDYIATLQDELEECSNERKELDKILSGEREGLIQAEEEFASISSTCSDYENRIESGKSDTIQLLSCISDNKNKINSSEIMMNNLKARREQLDKDKGTRLLKVQEIKEKASQLELQVKEVKEQQESCRTLRSEKEGAILEEEKNSHELLHFKNSCFEELKVLEARHRTLSELEREMEGFNRAVKAVLSTYKDNWTVIGSVSDIIQVPSGYETAIETALGAAVQNIVVDNEDTASAMIDYLKRNKLGRATFLPLTTIKPREAGVHTKVSNIKGYLGTADRLVSYDKKYRNVISNLLGRVIICSDLSCARVIAKTSEYSVRIVTLEGDVINAGGSFTGGSTNLKNTGIISRKNEINNLKQLLKEKKEQLSKAEEDITANQNTLENLKDTLKAVDLKLQSFTIEKQKIEGLIQSYQRESSSFEDGLKDIEVEKEQLGIEMGKNSETINKYTLLLKAVEENYKAKEEEVAKLQEEFKAYQERRESMSQNLTSIKVSLAEKTKSLEAMDDKLDKLRSERRSHLVKIEEHRREIEQRNKETNDTAAIIERLEKELEAASQSVEEVKRKQEELEGKRKELKLKLDEHEKQLRGNEESISGIVASCHKLELSKAKVEGDTENVINKLWDEYELSVPQAEKYRIQDIGIGEANRKVQELKTSIRELGDVNVNSIEEYKRVTERCSFLCSQREDLNRAEGSLIDIIEEITSRMRKQFQEGFKVIRENFNYTFRQLFGGGVADLKLEGDDILSSGIDIIVQPPGKKLQSLSLLSGGEKGLSAIALVFAILKMKPTPFCVLDEIEAALDDANVSRFADFIKTYSANTQFIMITHRKGTMAAADCMYGVTMEEKGVSKLLSLKLNQHKGGKEVGMA
jgi:chromosome segregation protein